jgi:hypothetical protein
LEAAGLGRGSVTCTIKARGLRTISESGPNSRYFPHAACSYIPFIVAELARDDAALVATLQGSADSQRPVYLYEAKMAFLLAMAQTRDRSLLDAGMALLDDWEPS